MKVKTIKPFHDLEAKAHRVVGEEFEVGEARFAEINATEFGVLVEAIPEEAPAEEPAPAPSVKPKKKAKKGGE